MKDFSEIPFIQTDRELAKFLKLAPKNGYRTIQRLARNGLLKGKQIGTKWRFLKPDVQAYLDEVKGGHRGL